MLIFLTGCASGSLLSDVTTALVKGRFGSGFDPTLNAQLNPAYRYLRVETLGVTPALLVLGYVDADPQGEIEVWYSAQQEILKLQNGRIVGTAGLQTDWRSVRFAQTPPTWDVVKSAPQQVTRVRDEMPGYRYGVTDQLTLNAIEGVPQIHLPETLPLALAGSYDWYRESNTSSSVSTLPASWYAVGKYQGRATVVYAYQCLSPTFCLSLQRWPLEKAPS